KALNFLTPHQKWGIHSTYSENLLMLTLSRGGPIVWLSETDAKELIPWRTLSGRQQLYQDHPWMRAFGESLVAYRPPIDTRSVSQMKAVPPNGFP
ncbi:TPA: hypothetical protein RFU03_005391, partial [Klebsiella pneumoniae subsp. pneumoniae]|nr:hypothetical protein [Klebsiella pneumoniae subsp. pneumoniae]